MEFIIVIALIVFSIIVHEVAHGAAAYLMGDKTAYYEGRLTLNPAPHIDPIGSVLIPGVLAITNAGFMVGWAKPVPFNPYNLRAPFGLPRKVGEALVALAGPATNFAIAVALALVVRSALVADEFALTIIGGLIVANLSLAVLNMIPFPPLDGSKVLAGILPDSLEYEYRKLENVAYSLGPFGLIILLYIAATALSPFISSVITWIIKILLG